MFKLKRLLSMVLSLAMLFTLADMLPQNNIIAQAAISSPYTTPSVTPPSNTHPRVLFRSADVASIQANLSAEQNSAARNRLNSLAAMAMEDSFTGESGLNKIEAAAFDYVINNKPASGAKAVTLLLTYLEKYCSDVASGSITGDQTRAGGLVIYTASEIYDWCYSLFTPAQRNTVISYCETIAGWLEIGYPPTGLSATTGHGSEAQLLRDLLAFAIAVYDERPDIWNAVGGRFYQEYVPAREYFNTANYNLEGDSYGLYRHMWDSWASLLITGMGASAPYNSANLYQTAYGMLYMRRPDGQYMRDGDTYLDDTEDMWSYWGGNSQAYLLDSAIGDDPYLKSEYARMVKNFGSFYYDTPIMLLIVNNPELAPKPISNLPLSRYFGSPVGMSLARTGWQDGADSPAVVAQMKVGEVNLNNHQHLDAGHFQIYYKGILASDSGVYQGLRNDKSEGGTAYGSEHYNMYMSKSVAHNTMLVYDPDEYSVNTGFPYYESVSTNRKYTRDGGQRTPYNGHAPETVSGIQSNSKVATVAAQEIDPITPNAPSYTYLKGDLTDAYSSKVSDYKRSFMFLNLFDEEVPGAMIVFDKVTSSNASFKKSWLLHGLEEPTINGTKTVFSRTYADDKNAYNGKMTVNTLLPTNPNITKVGANNKYSIVNGRYDNGKDWTGLPANSPTDEGNTWRIEVSPSTNSATDYFLNVIQVSDNDKSNYLPTSMIDTPLVYGAQISDRVVTFSKSGGKISSTTAFTAAGSGTRKYTMCDMQAGTWAVTTASGTQNVVASSDGGVLSFTASAGSVSATYVGSSGTPVAYNPTNTSNDYYSTRINNKFVYNKNTPRKESGYFVMPLSTISKHFNLSVTRNNDTLNVAAGTLTATMNLGSKSVTTNHPSVGGTELGVEVFEENGEIMVQPDGFVQLFGGNINMDELSHTAYIVTPTAQASNNLAISYSVDGGTTFTPLPDFQYFISNYTVELADNVPYVILKATADNGSSVYKVVDDYDSTKYRHGGFRYQPFNGNAKTQYTLEREADNGMIPIKNERGTGKVVYTDANSNISTYSITFKSKQPRITAFTQSSDFTDGNVTFIGGGAVANDNGTILDSAASAERMYALANVSSALVGSSMFVLPWNSMSSETSTAVTEKDCEFFSFVADTDCTVVVMLAQPADPLSEYAGWTCVNSGTQADGITSMVSPRNKNNYTNTDYFAMAYKWICGNQTTNEYRVSSPGINKGELTNNTHVKAGVKLAYAYSKSFTAGEKIKIYNPGCMTTDETTALMPVMVQWNNTHEIAEPQGLEISYSIDNETYTNIPLSIFGSDGYGVVELPDNVFQVYVNAQIPDEHSIFIGERNEAFVTSGHLLGSFKTVSLNRGSSRQYEMEQEVAPTTPAPVKLERGRVTVKYTAPGQPEKQYKIRFYSKQPRVTAYSRKPSGDWGKINFISGAAVNNDNKSILDTNVYSQNRMWTLANVSKAFENASLIMLPWADTLDTVNDVATYPNFVDFKADTDCTVYVLLDRPADPSSVYATGWTCVNNGIIPERLQGTGRYNIPRNVNNFSETDYFAMGYKWVTNDSTGSTTGNNIYRMDNPGVFGSMSGSDHVKGVALFSYVYAKDFTAEELVSIVNPGSMDPEVETSSLMPIIVDWHLEATDITLQYSVDDKNYHTIPGFKSSVTDYTVSLPDDTQFAYMKAILPDGTSVKYNVQDIYRTDNGLLGGFQTNPFGSNSAVQYGLIRTADENKVPIKNEQGRCIATYTDVGGVEKTFTINFTSKQPRLTSFTQNPAFTDGTVSFISGGAIANDNGTLLDSTGDSARIYTMANASKKLEGSSMFVMPWQGMYSANSYAVTNPSGEFFSFTADTDGTVNVILPAAAVTSDYVNNWTRVNNGIQAENVTMRTTARNYNDYTNVDYFATAYKWICGNDTTNAYRTVSPGITEPLENNIHITGEQKLTYAYRRTFKAGDTVKIYNPGCITTSEATALMAVTIKWGEVIEDISVSYSADGENYYTIPGFNPAVTEYNVTLPSNTFYAFVDTKLPVGSSAQYMVQDFYRTGSDYSETAPAGLIGDFHTQPLGAAAANQWRIKRLANNKKIPLKNEEGRAIIEYTDTLGAKTTYTINFKSRQPRLTSFTQSNIFTEGNVSFVGGAAVFNDNGTLLDSIGSGVRIYAMGNASESLEGSSMFVLPWHSMSSSVEKYNSTDEFFSFTAEKSGTVVVMLSIPASENSVYAKEWTLANNGTAATGITTFTSPRNKNDYTNTDYFAMAYKWICSNDSIFENNQLRTVNPGISGAISNNTHVKGNAKLTYAYTKHFEAGETVTIKGPGSFETSETTALMPVVVQWDLSNQVVSLNDIYAAYDGNDLYVVPTTAIDFTTPYTKLKTIIGLYDTNDKLIRLVTHDYADGENEFCISNGVYPADTIVKVFVWDMNALRPALMFNNSFVLSDILLQ